MSKKGKYQPAVYDAWDFGRLYYSSDGRNIEVGAGHTLVLRQSEYRDVVAVGEQLPVVAADSGAG